MNTASEQFVNDYLLVIENDREGWDDLIQMVRTCQGDVSAVSEIIRYDYETMVTNVISQVEDDLTEAAVNLLKQLLFGWGMREFDTIAKYAIEADKEVA